MTRKLYVVLLLTLILSVGHGCGRNESLTGTSSARKTEATADEEDTGPKPFAAGKVKETMDAAQYTYILIDTGGPEIWIASPKVEVNVGDRVQVPNGMMMKDFYSKTLDRTFPEIYFVGGVAVGDGGSKSKPEMPSDHPDIKQKKIDFSDIKKISGGKTVAELHAHKDAFAGQPVKIRAKVTKFTPEIMGKNWLHIQDGSTDKDLTVTTAGTAEVGDTVTVNGTVVLNKDFGYGYKYDIMIEDATL